jgi:superfamily II DNA helicase RecQ
LFVVVVFFSPEVITSSWWLKALTTKLKEMVSFIAIDEAHCVKVWGEEFRPAYQEIRRLKEIFPSVPFMALSATLPPFLESFVSKLIDLRKPYTSIVIPLDRPNIFYAVKRKQSLSIDFGALTSCIQSAESPSQVPKTLIFCLTKDACCHVYTHLWKKAGQSVKRQWLGLYHAIMTEKGKEYHQKRFKSGRL